MISNTRFSLARFSANPETNLLSVEVTFADNLVSVAGVAVPISVTSFMAEMLSRGQARGTIAVTAGFEAAAAMASRIEGNANILTRPAFEAACGAAVVGSRNDLILMDVTGTLEQAAWGGKIMPFWLTAGEAVTGGAFASKDIIRDVVLGETLGMLSESGLQGTDEVVVMLTIPPGGELRIDSDTFRVLLDGQNALHAQQGAWLTLTRDVLYIDIESATGGQLEGGLLYQERWL